MRSFLLRNKYVLCRNLTHYLHLMVEIEGQIMFMVHFSLVWLLVGIGLLVEGIEGQCELEVLVKVEQGLVEVQGQNVWFKEVWIQLV